MLRKSRISQADTSTDITEYTEKISHKKTQEIFLSCVFLYTENHSLGTM